MGSIATCRNAEAHQRRRQSVSEFTNATNVRAFPENGDSGAFVLPLTGTEAVRGQSERWLEK